MSHVRERQAELAVTLPSKKVEETLPSSSSIGVALIKKKDPVNRLARTLRRYKEKRLRAEETLVKVMEKVRLDKQILMKEKLDAIWKADTEYNNSKEVSYAIDKCRQRRAEANVR